MAQIKPLHIGEELAFINESDNIFTGNTHLEIDLINADSAKEVTIWVERDDTPNPNPAYPKSYELSFADMSDSSYDIILDGSDTPIFRDNLLDKDGNIIDDGEKKIKVNPSEHYINLDTSNLKYTRLYKFGKLIQKKGSTEETSGDNEELVYSIGDATKRWMENSISLSSSLEYKLEPENVNWVTITDGEGKEIYVAPNLTAMDRDCYIIYSLNFGDEFSFQDVLKLHIIQTAFKGVKLEIEVDNANGTDEKIKRILLPVDVEYLSRETSSPVLWDTLSNFKTPSVPLEGRTEDRWDILGVLFDKEPSEKDGIGAKDNELSFKWIDTVTEDSKLVKKDSGKSFTDIVCKISGINKKRMRARFVTAVNPETGELTWDSKDYYTVDGYTYAMTVLRTRYRDDKDLSFLLDDDNTDINEIKSITDSFKSDLSINDNTVVIVPVGTEKTIEDKYIDFVINDLQTCEGDYSVSYDGKDVTGDTDRFAISVPDTNIIDDTLHLDTASNYKDPKQTYYYAYGEAKDELLINGNFTVADSTPIAGKITYYPMLLERLQTAEFSNSFDPKIIKEEVLYNKGNDKAYKYSLQTREIDDFLGNVEGHKYKWHETKPANVSGETKFFIGSYAEGANTQAPMFNLVLQCDEDLPSIVDYEGPTEEVTSFKLILHLDTEKGVDMGSVWIDNEAVTEKEIDEGVSVTVHADSFDCCMPFMGWSEADGSTVYVNTSKDYTFTMPAHDVELWASFDECPCEVTVDTVTENATGNTYRIAEPVKREDTEYYFVIKNATDSTLTVYYHSYSTDNASFKLEVGEIGEVSMLWSPDWSQWVSRYEITKS